MFHVPNQFRKRQGPLASNDSIGNNGVFFIPLSNGCLMIAIASDDLGWKEANYPLPAWEHVSISIRYSKENKSRLPTWEEMCKAKDLFWDAEDTVIQFHPAKSQYVNCHPHTLHLWKIIGQEFPVPPKDTVGPT